MYAFRPLARPDFFGAQQRFPAEMWQLHPDVQSRVTDETRSGLSGAIPAPSVGSLGREVLDGSRATNA